MRRAPHAPRLSAFVCALVLTTCTHAAFAAWPTTTTTNVPVANDPTVNAFNELAVPDSCGGAIFAWLGQPPGINEVVVQRLDFLGQARWVPNGFPVAPPSPTIQGLIGIASDDAGGAFVTWSENRVAGNGQDIFVQHVLATGVIDPLWPPIGVTVTNVVGDQQNPKIVRDGSGGMLIAWEDSRGNVDFAPDIFAQRLNAAGAPLWAPNGVPVVVTPGQQVRPSIAGDGAGGLFVGWDDYVSGTGDVRAQHLEPTAGAQTWLPANGLAVCVLPDDQSFTTVTSDLGRMLIAWTDTRSYPVIDIYAQAISLTGVPLWTANGVKVSQAPDLNNSSPVIISDGLGGAIIGWQAYDGGAFADNIVAQHLDALGSLTWGASDLLVCGAPGRQLFMGGISDQRGGVIFFWDDRRIDESNIDIFARRVTGTGTLLWGIDGNAVSTAAGAQVAPIGTTDGAGGAIIGWQDQRASNVAVFAQQIGASGLVGVRDPSKNCEPDICGHPYADFGDAPEGIAAYGSGAPGHFPTCITDTPPGNQTIDCGAALSTPPGPTGYVEHVATAFDPFYFGFGCGPATSPGLAVDSEADGTEKVGPTPAIVPSEVSVCSPGVTIYEYELATNGLNYGVDERPGDGDAGIDVTPKMPVCEQWAINYDAWACATSPVPVFLNILVDWNHDGDWNDVVACGTFTPTSCAPEWAVKNAPATLSPGCNHKTSPLFPCGPFAGASWMRITLTQVPVSDDFPWRGSAPPPRSGQPGYFAGGETEDYPVLQVAASDVALGNLPRGFSLDTPSPNPTSGAATLRFSLPRAEAVELGVFDLVGRRVRRLDSAAATAGPHEIVWDGRDDGGARTSPGLYFVRLRASEGVVTRAVVVER